MDRKHGQETHRKGQALKSDESSQSVEKSGKAAEVWEKGLPHGAVAIFKVYKHDN